MTFLFFLALCLILYRNISRIKHTYLKIIEVKTKNDIFRQEIYTTDVHIYLVRHNVKPYPLKA